MKILIISIFLFLLGIFRILDPIKDSFLYVFGPLQFGLRSSALDIKGAVSFYTNLKSIRSENLALLNKVDSLRAELLNAKKAELENELLRQQLELKNNEVVEKELLLVNVLGNPTDRTGTTIVLDQGSKNGIKVGSNIIVGNHLVGVVTSVSFGRSIVSLITSPEVTSTVYDISSNRTEGLASGQFGTSVKMSKILPNELVRVGDTIVTSGRDGIFEPGFVVGKVTSIEGQSSEPLRSALLEPNIDLSKLEKVFVIIF